MVRAPDGSEGARERERERKGIEGAKTDGERERGGRGKREKQNTRARDG